MTSPTSRAISRLGIGTYRLALGVPEHERVLYKALERQEDPRLNLNLIDTSSNYSNGRSEQLIGKVLSNPRKNTLRRDEVVIATKFGYIMNENMRLLSEGAFQRVPPEEIVEHSRECFHCIHPEFMSDQLTRSLERLNTKFVDILFVHNPEYFLMTNTGPEVNIKKQQDILLERMSVLFEALEREIERGRIRSYGISSNSFSLKPAHAHFLPYQALVKMATKAFDRLREQRQTEIKLYQENLTKHDKIALAMEASSTSPSPLSPSSSPSSPASKSSTGASRPTPKPISRSSHGFGFLQMPGNLLEMEGVLTTAKWAKSQGLSVFVNRPLNAISPVLGTVRLASYPAPQSPTYSEGKEQILETLSNVGKQYEHLQPRMQRLKEMIEEMDGSLKKDMLSIMQIESASVRNRLHHELAKPIMSRASMMRSKQHPHHTETKSGSPAAAAAAPSPLSTPTSAKPNMEEMEQLIMSLDRFVQVFHQQVRFQEARRVEKILTEKGVDLEGDTIEQFAVEYLLEHPQVDSVLLGMKREPYVDFAHKMLKTLAEAETAADH
ncbi:hypothetical protein BGZ51_002395 [Haplosporangium sp. Z 767]|nr:hypothetical protein BGZ51_002395 [Haplosporangium sp. Z 767]KAF9194412.1 hypothetical protein BGZ50_006328 [Haplosporangium sp. Z 11]